MEEAEEKNYCQLGEKEKRPSKAPTPTLFFLAVAVSEISLVLLLQPNLIQIFALRFFFIFLWLSFGFFFIYCAKYAKHTRAHGRILVYIVDIWRGELIHIRVTRIRFL